MISPPDGYDIVFDPQAMLSVLERYEVECVVIGGYAANIHGATRPTIDLDVTPKRTRDNLARLSNALTEMDARVRVKGIDGGLPFSTDATALAGLLVLNLVTKYGDLDISMVPGGTEGYDDLIMKAVRQQIGDAHAAVASLDDVIRSKTAADRLKDHEALPELRELQRQQAQQRLRLAVEQPSSPGSTRASGTTQ